MRVATERLTAVGTSVGLFIWGGFTVRGTLKRTRAQEDITSSVPDAKTE